MVSDYLASPSLLCCTQLRLPVPRGYSLRTASCHLPITKFLMALSASRLSMLKCPSSRYLFRQVSWFRAYRTASPIIEERGLRNPPVYGATQRKPLKAVLPAFDALHTVPPVTLPRIISSIL